MPPLRYLKELRPADVERLVDALERSVRPEPAPEPPAETGRARTDDTREALVGEALRVFGEREERLREEARLTRKVLAQLREELTPPPQQLLVLRAEAGGRAGGRFRVRNLAAGPAQFSFLPRFDLPVSFAPSRFTLAPGAAEVIDLRLDLSGRRGAPGERQLLLVDVLAEGAPALKLWVELWLDEPMEGG